MNDRKQKLLKHIIEAHIRTAEPVGSGLISAKYMKGVSSPTVRNEMQELEREGLITHPHTSAGRTPTEAGYRNYIKNLEPKDISEKHRQEIDGIYNFSKSFPEKIKNIAKKTAELSQNATVVAFSKNDVYYTGLSNLFAKPEFREQNLVVNMSQVIDRLDEAMSEIHNRLDDNVSVFLGSDNPFSRDCGSVLVLGKGGMVFGILGPMRMDYERGIALVRYIKQLLEK